MNEHWLHMEKEGARFQGIPTVEDDVWDCCKIFLILSGQG